MALASVAFVACALRLGFLWYLPWRFLAGVVGAVLMIGAPSTVLSTVAPERRGRYGGLVFTGVGIGIAASGTLVPLMLAWGGLPLAWLALGITSLLLTALVWRWWPDLCPPPPRSGADRPGPPNAAVMLVIGVYALAALGVVPHMVFLVDFVARGLGLGIGTGSAFWVLFGLGALVGPLAGGRLADRIGFRLAIRVGIAVELVGVLVLRLDHGIATLTVSALLVGAMTPGFPPLILGRLQAVRGRLEPSAVWGLATIAFAIAQAGGAYGLSFLYARTADYDLLFDLALLAGALGMALALLDRRR
jgi:predicted MFS family arabinose efflux permease